LTVKLKLYLQVGITMIKLWASLVFALGVLIALAIISKPTIVDCSGEQEIIIDEWQSSVQPMEHVL
jgi:hypothetical protein